MLVSGDMHNSIGDQMTAFYCVIDDVPEETTRLIAEACTGNGVEYIEVPARSFDFAPKRQLAKGALLYRPGISLAAIRVEQFLYSPGVVTFYVDPEGMYFICSAAPLIFHRNGLPIPRSIPIISGNRQLLRSFVAELGGLPVVLKVPGGAGGIGVMRADSMAAVFSLVDYLLSEGHWPLLSSFVPDAIHWRVVVVGEQAVGAYRNITQPDDFRTYSSDRITDYNTRVPAALANLAVCAVHALRLEFGGVDVLEHPNGSFYLLEANFPCYFAQAQMAGRIDIAGSMIRYLLHKRERLLSRGEQFNGDQ